MVLGGAGAALRWLALAGDGWRWLQFLRWLQMLRWLALAGAGCICCAGLGWLAWAWAELGGGHFVRQFGFCSTEISWNVELPTENGPPKIASRYSPVSFLVHKRVFRQKSGKLKQPKRESEHVFGTSGRKVDFENSYLAKASCHFSENLDPAMLFETPETRVVRFFDPRRLENARNTRIGQLGDVKCGSR